MTQVLENPATQWARLIKARYYNNEKKLRESKSRWFISGKNQRVRDNLMRVHEENVRLGIKPQRMTRERAILRMVLKAKYGEKKHVSLPKLNLPD